MAEPHHAETAGARPRRSRRSGEPPDASWRTAITRIEPNSIVVRGYPVDELMGRLSFAEAVYLILRGEAPTRSIGRLFSAVLVSSLDHGVTPPSTLAARHVATSGAPFASCLATGILAFGAHHGGDIESCMRFLADGLDRVLTGEPMGDVARHLAHTGLASGQHPPGFGHRIHTHDPRAARLLQLAHDLELDGEHVRLLRAVEQAIDTRPDATERPLPLNINGAIAAVAGDLGFSPDLGSAIVILARIPGLIAHVQEERQREPPMREIDLHEHVYDGPPVRRLPETRR